MIMGLLAEVYDSPRGNFSNNGLSAKNKQVCIVNVDGPFNPSIEAQRTAIERFAAAEGLTLIGEYTKAETGKVGNCHPS
jgi:hypothetical protein